MIDPEVASASAAQPAAQDNPQEEAAEGQPSGDTGPLESMNIEPAENGGAVITHHPKASKRVKHAEYESMKPRKHVVKNHAELMKHLDKHAKRLKP